MEINNYKIVSGRIIGEEKNEGGLNAVYNIADLMQGNKIPIGYAKIENYPIHSGRMLSEEKDESGENKIFNIADILSDMVPASELGELAYKDSASGDYTPQGTVSQPTFTGDTNSVMINKTTENVSGVLTGGTLPSLTYDSQTNTVTFSAGTFPTAESKSVLKDVSGTVTPSGTVSKSTFTGTQGTITVE